MPFIQKINDQEAPKNNLVSLLQEALMSEYLQWDLYTSYKSVLKGLSRESIADHFSEHAEDELKHIETLQRYLVGMGENPTVNRKPIPRLEDVDLKAFIKLQLKHEEEAVSLYENLLSVAPDGEPLHIELENFLIKEQEHVHDLKLFLKEDKVMAKGCSLKCTCEPIPQGGYNPKYALMQKLQKRWGLNQETVTPDSYFKSRFSRLDGGSTQTIVDALRLKWMIKDKRATYRLVEKL